MKRDAAEQFKVERVEANEELRNQLQAAKAGAMEVRVTLVA